MIRAVLDTNVIVSALLVPEGQPAQIIRTWKMGLFEHICSSEIIDEVFKVLKRKHIVTRYSRITGKDRSGLKKLLESRSTLVIKYDKVPAVTEDPNDDFLIGIALSGKAHYLVSGDPHLLKVKQYQTIKIVTPKDFLSIFKKSVS